MPPPKGPLRKYRTPGLTGASYTAPPEKTIGRPESLRPPTADFADKVIFENASSSSDYKNKKSERMKRVYNYPK